MLHIFYHVLAINHWREIMLEHFRILQRQRFLGSLTLGIIGESRDCNFISNMLDAHCLGGTLHAFGSDQTLFEFPTLKLLKIAVQKTPEDQYLYIHTKGVSHLNDSRSTNWRWYMNAFLVGQLANLIPRLVDYDLVGAGWGNHFRIGPHFPGNFWLGRGDYLNSLPSIDEQLVSGLE